MTVDKYSRWPKLCDYYDRAQIEVHWPLGQAQQWSLAPTLNILFGPTDHPDPEQPQWKMSQPLWFSSRHGWSYRKTRWNADGQDVMLELMLSSTPRHKYWDYSIDAWLWTPDYEPLAHGRYVRRYAGLYYSRQAVWTWDQWFVMYYFWDPSFETEVHIFPTNPRNAWPEVPQRL